MNYRRDKVLCWFFVWWWLGGAFVDGWCPRRRRRGKGERSEWKSRREGKWGYHSIYLSNALNDTILSYLGCRLEQSYSLSVIACRALALLNNALAISSPVLLTNAKKCPPSFDNNSLGLPNSIIFPSPSTKTLS